MNRLQGAEQARAASDNAQRLNRAKLPKGSRSFPNVSGLLLYVAKPLLDAKKIGCMARTVPTLLSRLSASLEKHPPELRGPVLKSAGQRDIAHSEVNPLK
jgi:hypothetical protein